MYFVCVVAYLKGSKSVVNVLLLQIAQAQSSVGERSDMFWCPSPLPPC